MRWSARPTSGCIASSLQTPVHVLVSRISQEETLNHPASLRVAPCLLEPRRTVEVARPVERMSRAPHLPRKHQRTAHPADPISRRWRRQPLFVSTPPSVVAVAQSESDNATPCRPRCRTARRASAPGRNYTRAVDGYVVARYDRGQHPRVGRVVGTTMHRFAASRRLTELATVEWAPRPGSAPSVQQVDVRSLRRATAEEALAAGLL